VRTGRSTELPSRSPSACRAGDGNLCRHVSHARAAEELLALPAEGWGALLQVARSLLDIVDDEEFASASPGA